MRTTWANMSIFRRLLLGIGGPLLIGFALLVAALAARLDALGASEAARSRSMLTDRVAGELGGKVDVAWALVAACHAETTAAGTPTPQAQALCAERVRRARFGPRDLSYFWIHSYDAGAPDRPRMVMHPTMPALEGKDVSDFVDKRRFQRIAYRGRVLDAAAPEVRDLRATNLFVDMNRAVAATGRGVVEYHWPDPDRDMNVGYAKMSAVRLFPPWGWVLGTGEYVDHVDEAVAAQQATFAAAATTTTRGLLVAAAVIFLVILASIVAAGRTLRTVVADAVDELERLSDAVDAGRLRARASVERIHPEFQPLLRGANAIVDRFTVPLATISDYLGRLAKGDIPPRL